MIRHRHLFIMLVAYAVWGGLYLLTAWIGEVRGPVLDVRLPWDDAIPYLPLFQYPYLLCYVVVAGLFLITRDPRRLDRAFLAIGGANVVAFVIFALLPVMGPARDLVSQDARSGVLQFIHVVDNRFNAFPSLHVTNPWMVALISLCERRWGWKTLLFLAIAISVSMATLFVRQHYLADVAAGMGLAFLASWWYGIPSRATN